jgi:hypothetical protein
MIGMTGEGPTSFAPPYCHLKEQLKEAREERLANDKIVRELRAEIVELKERLKKPESAVAVKTQPATPQTTEIAVEVKTQPMEVVVEATQQQTSEIAEDDVDAEEKEDVDEEKEDDDQEEEDDADDQENEGNDEVEEDDTGSRSDGSDEFGIAPSIPHYRHIQHRHSQSDEEEEDDDNYVEEKKDDDHDGEVDVETPRPRKRGNDDDGDAPSTKRSRVAAPPQTTGKLWQQLQRGDRARIIGNKCCHVVQQPPTGRREMFQLRNIDEDRDVTAEAPFVIPFHIKLSTGVKIGDKVRLEGYHHVDRMEHHPAVSLPRHVRSGIVNHSFRKAHVLYRRQVPTQTVAHTAANSGILWLASTDFSRLLLWAPRTRAEEASLAVP